MHPLFENTQSLSDNDIEEKVMQLNRKYFQTQNPQVRNQISILLDDYKLELETRRAKQKLEAQQQQQNGESGLDNLIKVS
jgi:ribosome-associated translation inhibitor RaiA